MEALFLCPIGQAGMSPLAMATHVGLTAFVVASGSVLLAAGIRTYRRTAPRPVERARPDMVNPQSRGRGFGR